MHDKIPLEVGEANMFMYFGEYIMMNISLHFQLYSEV